MKWKKFALYACAPALTFLYFRLVIARFLNSGSDVTSLWDLGRAFIDQCIEFAGKRPKRLGGLIVIVVGGPYFLFSYAHYLAHGRGRIPWWIQSLRRSWARRCKGKARSPDSATAAERPPQATEEPQPDVDDGSRSNDQPTEAEKLAQFFRGRFARRRG